MKLFYQLDELDEHKYRFFITKDSGLFATLIKRKI